MSTRSQRSQIESSNLFESTNPFQQTPDTTATRLWESAYQPGSPQTPPRRFDNALAQGPGGGLPGVVSDAGNGMFFVGADQPGATGVEQLAWQVQQEAQPLRFAISQSPDVRLQAGRIVQLVGHVGEGPQQRQAAATALRQFMGMVPTDGVDWNHANRTLQAVLLFDGAIQLTNADTAYRQALASGNQAAIERARTNLQTAITSMVTQEGRTNNNTENFLNGWANNPQPGDGQHNNLTPQRVDWLQSARARDADFALGLFTEGGGIREHLRTPPRPQEYANALNRIETLAGQGDAQAQGILTQLQRLGGSGAFMPRLGSNNPNEAQQAVRDIEHALGMTSINRWITPTDLLRGTDPDQVRQVLAQHDRALQENIRTISGPLGRFVTRTDGHQAGPEVRTQAIADMRDLVRNTGLNLSQVIDWMEASHLRLRLHEAANPQAAAALLQELRTSANQTPPNQHASMLIGHLAASAQHLAPNGNGEGLDRILGVLQGGDAAAAQNLFTALKRELPITDTMQQFDEYRVRCLAAPLTVPDACTSASLDAFARNPEMTELARTNPFARDFLQWAQTEAILKKIEEAKGNKDQVLAAVRELEPLMRANNRYAFAAASQLLLDPQDADSWRMHFTETRGGLPTRPLSTGVLSEFAQQHPGELTGLRLGLARNFFNLPEGVTPPSLSDYTALSLCASSAPADSELRRFLLPALQGGVTNRLRAAGIMDGIVEAIRLRRNDSPDIANTLSDLYLQGVDAGFVRPRTSTFARWAVQDGDEPSIRIIAGLGAGFGQGEGNIQSDPAARACLEQLSRNPARRSVLEAALTSVAEPRVDRFEATYDPRNFTRSESIAVVHECLAGVYGNFRTPEQIARNEQHPKQAEHAYEAQEIRRVMQQLRGMEANPDLTADLFNWFARLPQRMEVRTGPGNISIGGGQGVFANAAEAVPGFRLSRQLRQSLQGLERLSIEGNNLTVGGDSNINIPGSMMGLSWLPNGINVRLHDVRGSVRSPAENELELSNVQGLTVGLGARPGQPPPGGFPLSNMRMRLNTTDAQHPTLHLEATIPPVLRFAMGALSRDPAPTTFGTDVPLSPEQAQQLRTVIQEFRTRGPQERNFQSLAQSLAGLGAGHELAPILGNVESVRREGDVVTINRREATHLALGEARLNLPAQISLQATRNGDSFTITDRSPAPGITVGLPLPQDVLHRLGVEGDVRLTGATIGPRDAQGQRRLTLSTNSILREVSLNVVERDGVIQPVLNNGNIELRGLVQMPARDGQAQPGPIDVRFSFNPAQLGAGQDLLAASWNMNVTGDRAARRQLLERFGIPDFISRGVEDVSSISFRNGRFEIRREGNTPARIEHNGVVLTVAPTVTIDVTRGQERVDGQNVNLADFNIQGLRLERAAVNGWPNIYAQYLPCDLRQVRVRQMPDGSATISLQPTGPIRGAEFNLDPNLNIQSGTITVPHPTYSRVSVPIHLSNVNGELQVDNVAEIVGQGALGLAGNALEDIALPIAVGPVGYLVFRWLWPR